MTLPRREYTVRRCLDAEGRLVFVYYTRAETRDADLADVRSKVPGFDERCESFAEEPHLSTERDVRKLVRRIQRREHARFRDANL